MPEPKHAPKKTMADYRSELVKKHKNRKEAPSKQK
jgi:hypothetical protein